MRHDDDVIIHGLPGAVAKARISLGTSNGIWVLCGLCGLTGIAGVGVPGLPAAVGLVAMVGLMVRGEEP